MATTIEVGLLGLGTVGSGVVTRLTQAMTRIEQQQGVHFHLAMVAVHHFKQARSVTLPVGTRLTTALQAVVTAPEIQIVIEVMGTITTAKAAIISAFQHGKSVVTANKDLMALAGPELVALAQYYQVDLFYEASVAGGIPILRTLADSYATDEIQQVVGIINGTANYILSAMTAGQPYDQALASAQAAGYAEANPTNDVLGLDATYKLMILSQFAFGQALTVAEIQPVGIDTLTAAQCQQAASAGWQLKLLAQAQQRQGRLYCRVAPVAVAQTVPISQVAGVQNGIAVTSEALGATLYTGPGAGGAATANSVLNDLLVAASHLIQHTSGRAFNANQATLPVTNLRTVPQAYLVFTTVAIGRPVAANIQQRTANCYQTIVVTPSQLATIVWQLVRQGAGPVTTVPIAFSTSWASTSTVQPVRPSVNI
ncbi:homoserine dehydrogenase [Lactobacillus sp. CBA3605]|uniref:homoserine dehydrogenase n=1 Tax=Lactobacillus sp. CBA3605 TaxID=2099788 RepID=UPI000CFC1B09|nr:homoserine dehydrogenase [Lactobacillus sp. CBA3605]AVK60861.1 homoserine dehydrogenase [Lactobacillus sp. CBA3605]